MSPQYSIGYFSDILTFGSVIILFKICLIICIGNIHFLFYLSPAFLWQLMRFTMLQLLKNLRSHSSQGKEITDADILNWANNKVKRAGRTSQMDSFKV